MKRILLSVFILFFIACWSNSFGQKVDPKNYDKFIEEVYGGTPYTTEWHRERYIELMQEVEVKKWDGQEYPSLERGVDLVNKYHPELKYDIGKDFDPKRFNPLKYFFIPRTKQVYRVTNTNYMIVVEPIER